MKEETSDVSLEQEIVFKDEKEKDEKENKEEQ